MQRDVEKFKKQIKEPKLQKIVDLLTAGKGQRKPLVDPLLEET